jgi:hypothetical protein
MRWLRGLLGAGVVAIGVVWGVGRRLPAEHVATATGVVEAGQDRVWELIRDPAAQMMWRKGLLSIRRMDANDGPMCWTEERLSSPVALCEAEEKPETWRVLKIVYPTAGFGGEWTFELVPVGVWETRVTITERTVIGSPMRRFVGRYVLRGDTSARRFLWDLQAEGARVR